MTDYTIKQLHQGAAQIDSNVCLQGWVKTRRDSKAGLSFIQLDDGSSANPIQVVAKNTLDNYETDIKKITTGCALRVEGKLIESMGKGQNHEVAADSITVIGWVDDPDTYPMQAKRHSMEFLREVAHLRPRTNTIRSMTRIRHHLSQAIHQFFDQAGFYWIHTPIITASDCEGAGELFRVSTLDLMNLPRTGKGDIDFSKDFFGKETFLTVSGQLNVEAYCLALSKVYTFGPTFRAENSNTSRHLAEFWMVEPEVAFADLNTIADLSEAMLKYVITAVMNQCDDDLQFFNQWVDKGCLARLEALLKNDFERMTYSDAITILTSAKQSFEFPVSWGQDLQSEHERYLCEKHVGKPLIVTDYPKDIKGFYMRLNDDHKTVAALDVLAPGIGEIIGGSQREERLDIFDTRLDELRLDKDTYAWYRDLRRYGSVPHGGFGLGFERLISYITGLHNVRDVIPFPRTPGHADF